MPGGAEEEHPAPRLCLVIAQGTSEGREQSLSLGLKIKFRHQEVTQIHLQRGRSCKEKQVSGRQCATAGYLLLLDLSVRAGWRRGKRKSLQRTELFHIFPSHWILLSNWQCCLAAVRYPDRCRYASPTVAGQKCYGLSARWYVESSLWLFNCSA